MYSELPKFRLNINFVMKCRLITLTLLTALMSEFFKWLCMHFRTIPPLRDHASRAIMAMLCQVAMKGCLLVSFL